MTDARVQRIPEHLAPRQGDIRLFRNKLLERLSRISPLTVLVIYVPMAVLAGWKSFAVGVNAATFFVLFLSGFVFWTLFEYLFHRYVFHFLPEGKFQYRLQFLIHGVHHQYQNDKDRLVMPVALSLSIAVLLFSLFSALFAELVWGFFAGFIIGYLTYDMTHYSIHHFRRPKNAWRKKLWKHHLDHHYRDTNKAYGVSSPFWDHVFGTLQEQISDGK